LHYLHNKLPNGTASSQPFRVQSRSFVFARISTIQKNDHKYPRNTRKAKMGTAVSKMCGGDQPQQDYELSPTNNRIHNVGADPRQFTTASEHPRFANLPRSPRQPTPAGVGRNRNLEATNSRVPSSSTHGAQFPRLPSAPDTERPDLSNIAFVHEDIKLARTKQALKSFAPTVLNLKQAAEDAGVSHMIGQGSCFGVSLEWATARMQNHSANLIGEGGGLLKPNVLRHALETQGEYETKYHEAKSSGAHPDSDAAGRAAIDGMLSAKGMRFSRWDGGIDGEAIGRKISMPGAHLINLTGFNDGHAIAAFTPPTRSKDPRTIVFDPNGGEFRMHPSEADYFFTALQARYECSGRRYGGAEVLSIHA
jgi:hypothetical protein